MCGFPTLNHENPRLAVHRAGQSAPFAAYPSLPPYLVFQEGGFESEGPGEVLAKLTKLWYDWTRFPCP